MFNISAVGLVALLYFTSNWQYNSMVFLDFTCVTPVQMYYHTEGFTCTLPQASFKLYETLIPVHYSCVMYSLFSYH